MFRKIKENKNFEILNRLLQNKRARSAIILVLWMFFFFIVFSLLETEPKNTRISALDKWKIEEHYEYEMQIKKEGVSTSIKGIRNKNEEVFSFMNQTYFLDLENLYMFENDTKVLIDQNTIFNFIKLRPNFLFELLSGGSLEYTTNYEKGDTKKGYSISASNISTFSSVLKALENSSVLLEVNENNETITKVKLELLNFQEENEVVNYEIEIDYFNVGDIVNINLE